MRLALLALFSAIFLPVNAVSDPAMFYGRPRFTEGDALAYYVWRDGETWHLRWTTLGNTRTFAGSVEATGGELKSLKRIDDTGCGQEGNPPAIHRLIDQCRAAM